MQGSLVRKEGIRDRLSRSVVHCHRVSCTAFDAQSEDETAACLSFFDPSPQYDPLRVDIGGDADSSPSRPQLRIHSAKKKRVNELESTKGALYDPSGNHTLEGFSVAAFGSEWVLIDSARVNAALTSVSGFLHYSGERPF